MTITNDTYSIVLILGETKNDFYDNVTEVIDEYVKHDQVFLAILSETQLTTLRSDDRVISVDNIVELSTSMEDHADNTLPVQRRDGHGSALGHIDKGNWGLHRHTSLTNNFAAENTDLTMNFTYPQDGGVDVDGTGVDIVLNLSGMPDITNDGYRTSSVSRIQQFQWNTVNNPGFALAAAGAVDYNTKTASDHDEAVLALACHNTYGWAKGANIYIMPHDWGNIFTWWEAVELFHTDKVAAAAGGVVRPTISTYSSGYATSAGQYGFRNINFRGNDYTTHRGLSGLSRRGEFTDHNDFGVGYKFELTSAPPISFAVDAMETAGVFSVISPGNYMQKIDVSGGPDYNNTLLGGAEPSAAAPVHTNREPGLASTHTIIVGNMHSAFNSIVAEKETLWHSSNKGPRIDCVIGASNLTLDKTHWGSTGDYVATGTSFAAPQVAGILAMVLQKYPTTTQAQARKYFREHAIGTDKLYDPGISPISDAGDYGDPEYFGNPLALQGYSGNILYLDPAMAFDPSTISDTTITYPTETTVTSKLNFTIAQINQKLATIP